MLISSPGISRAQVALAIEETPGAELYEHVVPAGYNAITPALPRDITGRGRAAAGGGDVWGLDAAGGAALNYYTNDATVTGQVQGWIVDMPAAGAADSRAGLFRSDNRRLGNWATYFGQSLVTRPFTGTGMVYIETDLFVQAVTAAGIQQWVGLLLSLDPADLRPFGLYFNPQVGANWRLFLAEQSFVAGPVNVALDIDTGVPGVQADFQQWRIEAGNVAGVPTLRALFGGVVVATHTGALGTPFNDPLSQAVGDSPYIGGWREGSVTADEINMLVGCVSGIRVGRYYPPL